MTNNGDKVLEVDNLTMHYMTRQGPVSAVDNITFSLARGEALGLVGESGCGKTSIALSLLRLLPDNAHIKEGHIRINGVDIVPLADNDMRKLRWKKIAMVFQAAMNSLNPVYTVGDQIREALNTHLPEMEDAEVDAKIDSLFQLVGLDTAMKTRYPHEYSGGMRQRAVIAMALSCDPELIIADEPTTALDVIVQDSLLKEITSLQDQLDMAMIYISHDVAVIAEVSDRVGVMYAGRLVEMADTEAIFIRPIHPYTYALMQAFPSVSGEKHELATLPGEPPDLLNPPTGCRFHPRCPNRVARCSEEQPPWQELTDGHYAACWNPVEVNL
ncbi:MAG: ABC transporter ATP-binding protein [Anaerolineales bacterium]